MIVRDPLVRLHTHIVLHPVCGWVCNSFFLSFFFALHWRKKMPCPALTRTPVRYSYQLNIVVLAPCLNLYIRPLPSLGLNFGVSRCAAPTYLRVLPCFLIAFGVLLICCVRIWSWSLSFQWVGLWSATKRWSRDLAQMCIARRGSRSQSWRALLGGHRVV